MKILEPDIIPSLEGKRVLMTSTFAEGKIMTISPSRKTTLENVGEGYDQKWNIIPFGEKEIIISSSKNGDMVCHYMRNEGNVSIKPLSEDVEGCVWKVGKEGEIYQDNPSGGERYLWMADDKLYVTLDGYLAERWIPIPDIDIPKIEDYNPPKEKSGQNQTLWFILMIILLILLFVFGKNL